MKRIPLRFPSPAMGVALLALFVALGGASYAAVRINGKNIKNRSISGAKLRNNTLTGKQIRESKLGKVPLAAKADLATLATNATNATNASHAASADSASSVSGVLSFPLKHASAAADLASAPQVPLGSRGPFQFYGKCYTATGRVHADIYIALSSGTATFSTEDQADGVLTPSMAETDRLLEAASGNSGDGAGPDEIAIENNDADFRATDGSISITGVIGLAQAKQGNPASGGEVFGPGDGCLFGGSVFG
jgi:hypothetical protein